MNNRSTLQPTEQHSVIKSLLLHISPGILVTVAIVLLKPLLEPTGFPPLLAFLLAILIIDIPFMLGVMLMEGKKLNGRASLKGVVLFRERVSWKTFAIVFIGAFVFVYSLIMLLIPLSTYLAEGVFANLPNWIFFEEQTQYEAYSKSILVSVFSLQLVLTGIAKPYVRRLK